MRVEQRISGIQKYAANPSGYALNRHAIGSAKELIFENKKFQRDFVVQI